MGTTGSANAPIAAAMVFVQSSVVQRSVVPSLLDRGVGLREIADLFGHASLASTRIYAAVDVAALREAALPWPQPRVSS